MFLTKIDFSYMFHKSYSIASYHYKANNKDDEGNEKKLDLTDMENRGLVARKAVIDLCFTINELRSDIVVFCFDDKSFRYDLLDTYKNGRGAKPEGFNDLMEELYQVFTQKGYNTIKVPGLEGDDCLALINNDPLFSNYLKLIVTKDEDANQLLGNKTMVYVPDSKKKTFYYSNPELLNFKPKEGPEYNYVQVDPELVLFKKLMKGCESDKIPQITPKGYRMKKIEEMYQTYLEERSKSSNFVKNLLTAVNSLDLSFTEEQVRHQLELVCLDGEFMPMSGVEYYVENFQLSEEKKEFSLTAMLSGTPYIDENYKK